jgi:glycosyltransferase involved in cell wall biosynthesis
MPKITVILTSFNHAKYIKEAIDSTLNQTFTDFELIILDDASSDNSWDLINQYHDPRIKAFCSEGQGEVVYRLNNAISELATGEYVAIHHSDDVWELDKLEKQAAFLDAHSEIGAVFTWVQIIDEHGLKLTGDWFTQGNKTQWQWLNQLFLGQNNLNHPSVLIRKQCYEDVGVYRYGLAQTPDAEMWSRVLIRFPIHVIQEKLTKHRLFSDNSNTSGPRPEVAIRIGNEWNVLRKNYLSITNFEDIVAIFPSLERFRNPKGLDNKFLLAMGCLYECKQHNAWQLGLTWLFELIDDKTRFEKIRDLYSFSDFDFMKLTAEFDVYYLERAKRERFITELQAQVQDLQAQVQDLQAHVQDLQTGNAWLLSQRDAWQKLASERESRLDAIRSHRGMRLVNFMSKTKLF